MARFSGASAALKLVQTVLYALEFCCAGLVLSIYSYFLAVLADRDIPIATWIKAVEGMSGVAVVYTIFAVLLTCCLGGKMFFAFLAIILDLVFMGAFIAIAVLTRDGAHSCRGYVRTPLGEGDSHSKNGFGTSGDRNITYSTSLGSACRMNTAVFAVSIFGAVLFGISALVQLYLGRHHQKDKRYGPSPANGYTSGPGRNKFWRRKGRAGTYQDAHMTTAAGAAPLATGPAVNDVRPSHDTAYTGSTVAPGATTAAYDSHGKPVTGYAANGANPYGYDHTTTTQPPKRPYF